MELRDRILEETVLLFKTYGIRSVTMDDIARQLAISKKTLYRHFRDKKEIVNQAVTLMLEQKKRDFDLIQNQNIDAVQEVAKSSVRMRQMLRTVHPSMMYDLQKYYPEAWCLYREFKNHIYTNIIENIERGIQQGVFRANINPVVLATIRIEQSELAFNPAIFPPEKFQLVEVQMELFDHFVRGVLTLKGLELYENYLSQEENLN